MTRLVKINNFLSHDGNNIVYRYFSSESADENLVAPVVILFHRESDFICDTPSFIESLGLPDCHFFSLDIHEGHVFNDKEDSPLGASTLEYYFQQFVESIKVKYGIKESDITIISHGSHAVIITAWIIDYAPNVSSVIFYSPTFFFKKYEVFQALLRNAVRKISYNLFPRGNGSVEIGGGKVNKKYPLKNNILFDGFFSWKYINNLMYAGKRIIRNAFSYHTPTLFIFSGVTTPVDVNFQLAFYANMGSHKKELYILPDLYPSSPDEDEDNYLLYKVRSFISEGFYKVNNIPSLFNSHIRGVTKNEYEKLRLPEVGFLRCFYWEVNKFALKHIGKFSTGIKLGLKTGFDSGASLDYIYRNDPSGDNLIGKAIDHYYLNNIGWHCTRMRKEHVEELMLLAGDRLSRERKRIRFLDVAAGHGSYILNVLERMQHPIDHVLMRDFELSNVQNGEKLIQEKKLASSVIFEQGDAFSLKDLNTLPQDRTLTIVSGFYELFSDNSMVLMSLKGIAKATEEGGYLIYTTKLWNPKLDYMARVLISHKPGEYWLLRRRTQLEIDQLVNLAGFVKITQRIDPWGMFSVTLAKKMVF